MDFEFSQDQDQLRETVRRFLSEQAPISPYVREQLDTRIGDELRTSGVASPTWAPPDSSSPRSDGGAGAGMVDMAVVLEEMGRFVHPGPFASTAVGAVSLLMLAAQRGERDEILESIAGGHDRRDRHLQRPAGAGSPLRATGDPSTDAVRRPGRIGFRRAARSQPRPTDGPGVFAVEPRRTGSRRVTATPTVDATRKQAAVGLHDTPARRLGHGDASAALAETEDRMIVGDGASTGSVRPSRR